MKKRIVFAVLFVLIICVIGALTIFPEFCYFWQDTPVLKDIYAWCGKYFETFILAVTKSEKRDIYLSIIGCVLISIFVFGCLRVKKVKVEDQKQVEVSTTPVINNEGSTTVVVVEEN